MVMVHAAPVTGTEQGSVLNPLVWIWVLQGKRDELAYWQLTEPTPPPSTCRSVFDTFMLFQHVQRHYGGVAVIY